MSTFISTRGGPEVDLAEAVFRGLAPDGGLFVPTTLPQIPAWPLRDCEGVSLGRDRSFTDTARIVAPSFFPGVEANVLRDVVEGALSFPVPLVEVEPGRFVLELFHGPTHAFKDVGARFMAHLLPSLLGSTASPRTVVVATSGDTGGAVASAFHNVPGHRVVALFPKEGVSDRQRRQMTTLGGNVHAIAVSGTFDDCQSMVKDAFADPALHLRHGLTSANSINVARLLPQAFYYLHAAAELKATGAGHAGAHFVVPSGNLGNLCAGLLAARAGMPASGFTAASNANRGFVDLLNGSDFTPRPSVTTCSNAMDVGAPSNLERLRWLHDGDDIALRASVVGRSVTDSETVECIRALYERTGYLMDPHTAVAFQSAIRQDSNPGAPMVVLATAHPAKFPDVVRQATGVDVPVPPNLDRTATLPEVILEMDSTRETLTDVLERLPS
ncbi:MAG: threonine synthase [Longimicrobiales bacterium]